jgi:hypothetical protein
MPVFERYRIERYKEILINQPSGNVPDGGFSSYTLDNPSISPNGTGDFLGVIKTVVLLGEIYKETMDTRNMSFTEFNNLTQQQFDDYVSQGLILLNRQTNGQPQRIGWVEMSRSHASFYYQSCQGGKRPISEHYFDLNEFAFDNKTVIGEGAEIEPTEALTPIGNFDPNIANNLGVLRPRFEILNLTDYIRFAMVGSITNSNGETFRINNLSLTDQTRPNQVSLLMANRGDHFDNQFATQVSPGKWGMVRRTIFESIKPGTHVVYPQLGFGVQQTSYNLDFSVSDGQCLQTTIVTPTGGVVVVGGGGITTTPQIGGPMSPPKTVESDTSGNLYADCFQSFNSNFKGIENILSVSPNNFGSILQVGIPNTSNNFDEISQSDSLKSKREELQFIDNLYNIRDPRELYSDNINIPSGILQSYLIDDCELKVIPSYLDKDGQIPEPVGPHRVYNLQEIRDYLYVNYKFSDKTLFEMGKDENGIRKYSDGKSFREYAGTSAYGWYSSRYAGHYLTEYPGNTKTAFSLKIPTRNELENASSQGLFANSSAYFVYENPVWKSVIDFLITAKESAISFVKKDGKPIKVIMPDATYKKLYDTEFIKIVIISKTKKYFALNAVNSNIFLGFNDDNIISYENENQFLSSLNKNDIVDFQNLSLEDRNLQYGKNPFEKIGLVRWFDVSRFQSPSIKINSSGVLYIELIDTTYLLDIYFSLMNLHLSQVNWEVILKYVGEYEQILSYGGNDFEPLYNKIQKEIFFYKNSTTDVLNESTQPVWPPIGPFSFDEFGNLI